MNNRYSTRHLYRVWTGDHFARECIYTHGRFNDWTTGRFIAHEMYADKIRPVEVWVQCPECEHEEGWIPVNDVLEIGGVVECDACGYLIPIIDGPVCEKCHDALAHWEPRPRAGAIALICDGCGAILDELDATGRTGC